MTRRAAGATSGTLVRGRISLDPVSRTVELDDAPVDLTAREYALLEALMRRAGRILSRASLEELLYGFEANVASNTIEVHIASLRRKLGHDFLETVRGMGYRMKP